MFTVEATVIVVAEPGQTEDEVAETVLSAGIAITRLTGDDVVVG